MAGTDFRGVFGEGGLRMGVVGQDLLKGLEGRQEVGVGEVAGAQICEGSGEARASRGG